MSFTYGLAGERTTLTLPGGGVWNYTYTSAFNVLDRDDPNSVRKMISRIMDDQGRAVDYWLDESGRMYLVRSNQVFDANLNLVDYLQTAYSYDSNAFNNYSAWLVSLTNTWNVQNAQGQWQQSVLVKNQYTYDASGQRLTNQITSGGSSRTEQYSYDELNRLRTVDYGDGQTQSYTFDAMGNRLSKQDSATGTENYSYNAANMLLIRGSSSYVNDTDGNTLTGGGRTNVWDSQNRLVQCVNGANTSSFVYSADGQRRQSTVNGTTTDFLFDNTMLIREQNHANGANLATYLIGIRGPEYRRDDTTGQVRWYLYDGHGSVLGELDPTGNITSSRKYDVYGLVRGGSSPGGTSGHKFVGQLGHLSEDNTGLICMQARYYDPVAGRFASEDPAGNGTNWYGYCDEDPVNRIDADGKTSIGDELVKLLKDLGLYSILGAILTKLWIIPLAKLGVAKLGAYLARLSDLLIGGGQTMMEAGGEQLESGLLGGSAGQVFTSACKGIGLCLGGAAELAAGIALKYASMWLLFGAVEGDLTKMGGGGGTPPQINQ